MDGQQSSARWALDEPLDVSWRHDMRCHGRFDLPWISDTAPDAADAAQMSALCAVCPVRRRCAAYGLTQPGGFYAGVFVPWNESAEESPARDRAVYALTVASISATPRRSANTPRNRDEHPQARRSASRQELATPVSDGGGDVRVDAGVGVGSGAAAGTGDGPGRGAHNRRRTTLP